jgi:hypothetical protein
MRLMQAAVGRNAVEPLTMMAGGKFLNAPVRFDIKVDYCLSGVRATAPFKVSLKVDVSLKECNSHT